MQAEFINKSLMGLIKGHIYELTINRNEGYSLYDIKITYDVTEDKEVDIFIHLTSEHSIKRYFKLEMKKGD